MTPAPHNPKIYHITHLNNLPGIATSGELISDSLRVARGLTCSLVGMTSIKYRRLEEIEVAVCPGTKVGEYVPFYFCPRSIMLYLLHKGNHPDLTYRGGQQPILHLEGDLNAAIQWATIQSRPWAFTDRNAGTYFVEFYNHHNDLSKIDWIAVASKDFRDVQVKEGKQAEFLTFGTFPWTLIQKIGTIDSNVATPVQELTSGMSHQPVIEIQQSWYF